MNPFLREGRKEEKRKEEIACFLDNYSSRVTQYHINKWATPCRHDTQHRGHYSLSRCTVTRLTDHLIIVRRIGAFRFHFSTHWTALPDTLLPDSGNSALERLSQRKISQLIIRFFVFLLFFCYSVRLRITDEKAGRAGWPRFSAVSPERFGRMC